MSMGKFRKCKRFEIKFKDAPERDYRLNVCFKEFGNNQRSNERKFGGEDVVYGNRTYPTDSIIPLDNINEVNPAAGLHRQKRQTTPANFDWRTYGMITTVKNQGFGVGSDFQYYVSGIYSPSTCPGVNHAMLAIGYGVSSSNVPYWTTKNQWGTGWGESGFMRFRRNVNLCGFTTQNNAPVDIWQ
uniref:Peptidase C1A papain C-terminal domain-containing protein n=1 Tax=Ditylenchus dipsaci TaxID=166011 RepID=A0A915EG06_9BILA